MGAYLSEPVTRKDSTDESNEFLDCGASSMQGWRMSQEDAHNTVLNFDTNASFFAVYDGHGGAEVALYCAKNLPKFLKIHDEYKLGNYERALQLAFIDFDGTLVQETIIEELKRLVDRRAAAMETETEDEDIAELHQESHMPIDQLIEKYKDASRGGRGASAVARVIAAEASGSKPISPILRGRRAQRSAEAAANGEGSSASSSSSSKATAPKEDDSEKKDDEQPPRVDSAAGGSSSSSSSNAVNATDVVPPTATNGEAARTSDTESLAASAANNKEGDAAVASTGEPPRSAQLIDAKEKTADDDTSSDDDDDASYNEGTGSDEDGSEADSDDDNGVVYVDGEDDDEDDDDEEEEDGEEQSEEENGLPDDEDDDDDDGFLNNMIEAPGSSSGCTAVVALLVDCELFVANAGDSRCVVCRDGKALEMSLDHKPEDEEELERIKKAGGRVTMDGRVNGGLNLSRAIGDHGYKQNKDLKPEEQMISAKPDIKRVTISPADEFMVIACDGIWNFMSSEEVVEFVKTRINDGREKLSSICEELFTNCLASNTMGDGTGCDNMTAVIVRFKPALYQRPVSGATKRSASPVSELSEGADAAKRIKTDDVSDSVVVEPTAADSADAAEATTTTT